MVGPDILSVCRIMRPGLLCFLRAIDDFASRRSLKVEFMLVLHAVSCVLLSE